MRLERHLVSVHDLAALMGVSAHTVYRWLRDGRIVAYGVGRPRIDLDAALAALERPPATPAPTPIRGGAYRASQFRPSGQADRPRGRQNKRPA